MSTRRKILMGLASLPLAGLAAEAMPSKTLSPLVVTDVKTTMDLLTKWHKVLEYKFNGIEADFYNCEYCWPLEWRNGEPLAVACAQEMQQIEDQCKALSASIPTNEPEFRWYVAVIKNVIPWIRRRYSNNIQPLASCQFDLKPLQLDVYPVVPHEFPWRRTGKVVTMSYQDSKSIVEQDFFPSAMANNFSQFEQMYIEQLAIA